MIKSYTSEGIVLSRKNYGEADRLLVIYSKHFGQLRLLAKGVRKPKSRKRGHLEVFSHIKFSASRGSGMDILTEAETLESNDVVRKDLRKISVAFYLCEVLGRLTREGEKHEKIFSDAVEFLKNIKVSKNLKDLRKQFVVRILIDLGFWSDGEALSDPDQMLENIIERRMNSIRVGRALLM